MLPRKPQGSSGRGTSADSRVRRGLPRFAKRRGGLSRNGKLYLDRLARTLVMLRANAAVFTDEGEESWHGRCQKCGRSRWLSWCHVITRGAWSARWDPMNAFAWCSGCHRRLDQYAEEKRSWVIEQIGEDQYDLLVLRSKGSRTDYAATEVFLKAEIAKLTGRG